MTTWLLTGGAGYIGAHVIRELQASGREVVVLDDLSAGVRARVPADVPFVQCSIADTDTVARALDEYRVDGVIHFAALKAAGESVEIPLAYYEANVGGMLSLLRAMERAGTRYFVYSSSAAVYGTPIANPIPEDAALAPESPYGETKVVGEWLCADAGRARNLSWVALRYFNVAGAGSDELGDTSVNNLIPMVFRALERGERPQIFGTDYPTPDGTCIRDYIHVQDLANAHVAAAAYAESDQRAAVFNVGRGLGASVREVMDVIAETIGRELEVETVARRPGDPPASIADPARIAATLDWRATRDLRDMVRSAWSAWQARA